MESCIVRNTFNFTEFVNEVAVGMTTPTAIEYQVYTEDFTNSWHGRCVTIEVPHNMSTEWESMVSLKLEGSYDYALYFILNENPLA